MSVSRETRLQTYCDLLVRWSSSLNLSSRADSDQRGFHDHIVNSLMILPHLPPALTRLVDLGSGQGFPAIPLAIMAEVEIDMIEADRRKAAFLNTVLAKLSLAGRVHCGRIEHMRVPPARCVTARALAPLDRLLSSLARPFLQPDGCCLFLKGPGAATEIALATQTMQFQSSIIVGSDRTHLVKITDLE